MFSQDFYPTKPETFERMIAGYDVAGKVCLEPSGGKGNLVDCLKSEGAADVISCEINKDLKKILQTKCKVIADDFLTVESHQISHVHFIIMNPPFSADEKHILHAYDIAPAGCNIISLANLNTVNNTYTESRRRLKAIISSHGTYESLKDCFSDAERQTNAEIALIKLQKPGESYSSEFEGFFTDDEPEETGEVGLMSYNFIRDLVNRYVAAVKVYDEQLNAAVKMNQLTKGFYSSDMALSITEDNKTVSRNEFKKEMQKAGWKFIFEKLNMQKYATKGLKEDINKFIEQQTSIPFTMRNIYKMIDIVIGTTGSRMDKAVEEVFDKLTRHTHENRYNVAGFKTNSHYLINQKFIINWMVEPFNGSLHLKYNSNAEIIEDMLKALCYITGNNYDSFHSLGNTLQYQYKLKRNGEYQYRDRNGHIALYHKKEEAERQVKEFYEKGIQVEIEDQKVEWGEWFDWGFFEVKAFKKGTMHFKFKSIDLWATFNRHIAKIKGFPLPEFKEQTAWQKKQNKPG